MDVKTKRPEDIASLLAQAIREGVFPPGTHLVQEDLAKRFQVSRTPVRDALRILVAEGTVAMSSNGSGAMVRVLSIEELTEIYDLRILIETYLAPLITEGCTTRDLNQLRALIVSMEDQETAVWMRSNYAFHTSLYRLAGHPRSEEIAIGLLSAAQPYSLRNIDRLGGRQSAQKEHVAMLDALEAHDPTSLTQHLTQHLAAARDRLLVHGDVAVSPDPLGILRS